MTTRNFWPLLIIVLVGGFLILGGWSFYRAARGTSAVTDADYYSRGLRYNQTLLERTAAASLGWDAATSLQGRIVTVQLRDRDRRAVTGARGTLVIHGKGTGPATEQDLLETAPGSYQAELPAGLHGEHPGEIAFQLKESRLSKRLLLSLD